MFEDMLGCDPVVAAGGNSAGGPVAHGHDHGRGKGFLGRECSRSDDNDQEHGHGLHAHRLERLQKGPALATGHYQVQASHEGFKTETHTGITLEVTQQVVIPFTLEVGTTQQQITVTGEAPIVNTEDATLGGLVNGKMPSKDLPLNGRNYIDLSLLQAGVTRDINIGDSNNGRGGVGGIGTTFNEKGLAERSNNFTLDWGDPAEPVRVAIPARKATRHWVWRVSRSTKSSPRTLPPNTA